jgi:hypothetical protein
MKRLFLSIVIFVSFVFHIQGKQNYERELITRVTFHFMELGISSYGMSQAKFVYENIGNNALTLVKTNALGKYYQYPQSISNDTWNNAISELLKSKEQPIHIDMDDVEELLSDSLLEQEERELFEDINSIPSDTIHHWICEFCKPSGRIYIEIATKSDTLLIRPTAECEGTLWELTSGETKRLVNHKDVKSFLKDIGWNVETIFTLTVPQAVYYYKRKLLQYPHLP